MKVEVHNFMVSLHGGLLGRNACLGRSGSLCYCALMLQQVLVQHGCHTLCAAHRRTSTQ